MAALSQMCCRRVCAAPSLPPFPREMRRVKTYLRAPAPKLASLFPRIQSSRERERHLDGFLRAHKLVSLVIFIGQVDVSQIRRLSSGRFTRRAVCQVASKFARCIDTKLISDALTCEVCEGGAGFTRCNHYFRAGEWKTYGAGASTRQIVYFS
jgi:hypothetical protein